MRAGRRGAIHITAAIIVIILAVAAVAAVFGGWFAFNVWPDAPGHGTTYTYTGGFTASNGAKYYEFSVGGSSTLLAGTSVSLAGSSSSFYIGILNGPSPVCEVSYGSSGAPANVAPNCVLSAGETLVVSVPAGGFGATGVSIGGTMLPFGSVGPAKYDPIGCGYVPPGC